MLQLYSTIDQFEKNHCFGVFAFYSIGERVFKMCRNSFSGMKWREGEDSGAVVIVDSVVQIQENHKTATLLCRANRMRHRFD